MRTILDQLESIMGGNKSTWDEQEDTKSVPYNLFLSLVLKY